jgi:hypothetical protein
MQEFLKASIKQAAKEERQKGPRLAKMPQLNDFQFFDIKRIEELYGIEHANETWKYNQLHRRHELEKTDSTPEEIEQKLAAYSFSLPCILPHSFPPLTHVPLRYVERLNPVFLVKSLLDPSSSCASFLLQPLCLVLASFSDDAVGLSEPCS